ncbi:hypothetical protein MKX01_041372 [Papaver californicum]|nr:hypothetical protein MKX01_041372 [Papaver californicum]
MKYMERYHSSHPCKLHLVNHQRSPYICDGCMEIGFDSCYRCEEHNYDLHPDCISAASTISHPFYIKCNFKFFKSPPGERICDACGGDIKGFVYHCDKSGRDLHPCCSKLPNHIEGEGVKFNLHEKLSAECSWCGKRRIWDKVTGWSYVSTCNNFHFHVNCVKEMVVKIWERGHFNTENAPRIGYGEYDRDFKNGNMNTFTFERRIVGNIERGVVNRTRMRDGVEKYLRIAKLVMRSIVSIILGDPTVAITWLVESLISST